MLRGTAILIRLLLMAAPCLHAAPAPESVAVLFNTAVPESRKLAVLYCETRRVPMDNLVGLEMPTTQDISREQYEEWIAKPLRAEFDRKGWWRRMPQEGHRMFPVSSQIRVVTIMRGVPLRIQPTPPPAKPDGTKAPAPVLDLKDPFKGRDDASVDSELAMVGVEGLPSLGVLQNKYHGMRKSIADVSMPFLLLTARIDGPGMATCERMIRDAVATEENGLWGMSYVDVAQKHPQGDGWLESVAARNLAYGLPTVVDRFKETLPRGYPMTRVASYFGWYTWNLDGPFLNPNFRFRPGAVAVHIHSFSAEQLNDPGKNWCAGLLERGAAVTVGNVYEPYLHLTHDLGILHQRLLDGHSWVEACWMAMPVCSWQGVVLGDPLYEPYRHLRGSGRIAAGDKPFRALRAAMLQWPGKPDARVKQLEQAAKRTKDGIFLEAVGLEHLALKRSAEAMMAFQSARTVYASDVDRLRQDLHAVAIDRTEGRSGLALRGLNDALLLYQKLPEVSAVQAWLQILQPPAQSGGKK